MMSRMTDEEIRMAKRIMESVGKSEGLEDVFRKKALAMTKDSENWVLVMLLDMIIVGMSAVLHRAKKGKEEDELNEVASSHLTEAVGALASLALSMTMSGTEFKPAISALSRFAAIMILAEKHKKGEGEVEKGMAEDYIKNEGNNPLW